MSCNNNMRLRANVQEDIRLHEEALGALVDGIDRGVLAAMLMMGEVVNEVMQEANEEEVHNGIDEVIFDLELHIAFLYMLLDEHPGKMIPYPFWGGGDDDDDNENDAFMGVVSI
jgi:hypothetical protein